MRTLLCYDALLANEWEERILPHELDALLEQRVAALPGKLPRKPAERQQAIAECVEGLRQRYRLDSLASGWAARCPYGGPPDAPLGDYAASRRACFREYWAEATRHLPPDLHADLDRRYAARRATDLPAYHQQLTLLMTLRAEAYQEHRTPLPAHMLHVALIAGGRYQLSSGCWRSSISWPARSISRMARV